MILSQRHSVCAVFALHGLRVQGYLLPFCIFAIFAALRFRNVLLFGFDVCMHAESLR